MDDRARSERETAWEDDFELSLGSRAAVGQASEWLLARQHESGYWCGELEGDSILQSEYLLLLAWLGEADTEPAQRVGRQLLRQQDASGGWTLYPGGPLEISASVKAYFGLKLLGHDPDSEPLRRARDAIQAAGGADRVNSFTRFYLALLGQIAYDHCPAVPPEMLLLPRWAPINIYRISAWSRTIFVPLSIMWARRPAREIPASQGIAELFLQPPEQWGPLRSPGAAESSRWFSWEATFRGLDRLLKTLERWHLRPLRHLALRRAERWMTERFAGSDGLGAIFPPIIWSVVALKTLGYEDDSAEVRYCREQLDALMIHEGDTTRLQPCKSPVWDTALTVRGLAAAADDSAAPAIRRGISWLLEKEVTRAGDWAKNVVAEPSGWFFEHNNEFYPDVDDTIMVLMALRSQVADPEALVVGGTADLHLLSSTRHASLTDAQRAAGWLDRVTTAARRARKWVLAMQNRDGGWGAFDRDNDAEFLCHVPFADHNAMIDPSTPDITARVLEALAEWGLRVPDKPARRAVDYLRQTQEPDGAWPGRWGVNYIYGVWQVLVGLHAIGVPESDPMIQRGADWLLRYQHPSGGWGETPMSYDDPTLRGQGNPTPSQTAWAILGLLASPHAGHPAVERGIRFLIQQQSDDGSWKETDFTGTGFPQVFYLRYHLYPIYFPLLALATWNRFRTGADAAPAGADRRRGKR